MPSCKEGVLRKITEGFFYQGKRVEKGMANHFSILDLRIPWREGPDRLQFMGVAKSD